jgi:hypothetical protein
LRGWVGRNLFDPVNGAMTTAATARSIRRQLDSLRFLTCFRYHWISLAAAVILVWIVIVPLAYLIVFSFR